MSALKTQDVYIVTTNSDLTEGRGRTVILAICKLQSTALRLASKRGVMGSDADVSPGIVIVHEGKIFGPVILEHPTEADIKQQDRADKVREIIDRAIRLGLSEDDIKLLVQGL